MDFIKDVMIGKLQYNANDFKLLQSDNMNDLYKMIFNDIECGLLFISSKDTLDRETQILSTMIQKDSTLDFFILTNVKDTVVVFTDHKNTLVPQYIDMSKGLNLMELICGKPFMKNLISNRGVEYYD